MNILRRRVDADLTESEVTPHTIYKQRRQFMTGAIASAALAVSPVSAFQQRPTTTPANHVAQTPWLRRQINQAKETGFGKEETLTPYRAVTSYNNFYEFGMDKSDPAARGGSLNPDPWQVTVEGLCKKQGTFALEDLIKGIDLEERIYRLRCVEAWSMVIPWIGLSLAELIKRCQPAMSAKYIEFETLVDPVQMPAQSSPFSTINWPYREGLRLDEAMHPLTIMAVGLYGEPLPNQNGAPWRLVVPWKYGFKSIKSIVKIRFRETMPTTTWNQLAPREYGFYANVNPEVDHPRWSQASERRLPSGLFNVRRIPTAMFNGYEKQVASLYRGMDLRKFF